MKDFENYVVYGLVVTTNEKNYIYIGSGDKAEPARRMYDFRKQHSVSNRIQHNTKNGNFWKVSKVIINCNITKNAALLLENELVGILAGHSQCLNTNKPLKGTEWASIEELHKARQKTVNFLQTASFVRGLEDNPLYKVIGLNDTILNFYKTVVEIVEQKANQLK